MGHRQNESRSIRLLPSVFSSLECSYVVSLSSPMLNPTPLLSGLSDGTLPVTAGWIALIWYAFILGVCALGYFQM